MKPRMTGLFILLLILSIGSCSLLTKPSAVHDLGYPYTNTPSEATTLPEQPPVTVDAPKWLTDTHIRYRLLYAAPTQVRFYSLDRWIAPPSELFEQLLNNSEKQWPTPVNIKLQVFEQQFDSAEKAKVVMRFTATSVPDDNKHQAQKREFNLQLPCPTPDAKGAVTGFNVLTKKAVDNIHIWLVN
ncbi:putative lipoprotein [Methyloglobulus morosus KoM1]|uniref:Putative lipoprotein n=1 Tax=Methyloglobulus morosus KoM1 TaxID=1116472 RepID=V5CB07_9GAMM|nr:ABC-type transport auxiliary lipoprotein family protein [Methyloglobulus morosus]ESS73998.1 putative lipoprotein [Methyloglobulus morosus KoM1]